MTYSSKAIANYFLKLAELRQQTLNPMKLQKLVYLAHGWYLAITGEPLISEKVEAWQWGPVIRALYHEFKEYGKYPIKKSATDIERDKMGFFVVSPPKDPSTIQLLDKVYDVYGGYTAIQLSTLTHEKGTPWDFAWKNEEDIITNELIKDHYTTLAN